MDKEKNYELLKAEALKHGMTLFGVANLTGVELNPHSEIHTVIRDLPYGVSIGYRLSPRVLATIKDRPTLIYKHHYKTVNWILDQTAERLVTLIQQLGGDALAIPASQTVDWEAQVGHISHKQVAYLAGHGWIGKSGLLVNPKFGAQVRYATILTNLPLKTDIPVDGSCGTCRKCIDACPAGALSEKGWDKDRCLAQLKKFAGIRGIGQYICGVCIKVCDGKLE